MHVPSAGRRVEVCVVSAERRGSRCSAHGESVSTCRGDNGFPDDEFVALSALAGDHNARDQAFEIPFPRSPGGFVKVVEVEHEGALRRGVEAEIRYVRVPAGGHQDACCRFSSEVSGHERRGASVERKRALTHALGAQRYQFLEACCVLFDNDCHRGARCAREFSEHATRQLATFPLPAGASLIATLG